MYKDVYTLSDEDFRKKHGKEKPSNVQNPAANQQDIKSWILLSGEILSARQYRVQRIITFFCFALSVGALLAAVLFSVLPWVKDESKKNLYWIEHNGMYKVNVIFGASCLVPLAILSYNMCARFFICRRLAKRGIKMWAPKRKSITLFAMCRLIAQVVNILFWLLQNVYILAKHCSWFNNFVNACTLVQWSCLNFNFTLDIVWAECLTPWLDKEGKPQVSLPGRKSWRYAPDPLIMDQPLGWRHVYKVVIGLIFQAIIFFYAAWLAVSGGTGQRRLVTRHFKNQALGSPACFQAEYTCAWDVPYGILVYSFVVMVFLHAILAFFYIERAKTKLQKAGPYLLWERPHKMIKILEASSGWITSIAIASVPAMFLGDHLSCLRMMVPWFGILPVQVTTTIITCTNAFYYYPRLARQGDVVLEGWLRELVWREKDVAQLRESMIQALPDFQELLKKEPVFCFDATAKLLVWTDLVYTFEDNAEAKETQAETGFARCMGLCCPCCTTKQRVKGNTENHHDKTSETGPLQEFAQELPAADPLPGIVPPAAPAFQEVDRTASSEGPRLERHTATSRTGRTSRQGSDASNALNGLAPGYNNIVSLKLSEDGYLRQEGTDVKIEIADGVASEAGLGLAMRLFNLDNFEILYEEKLQTKVLMGWSKSCLVLAFRGTANAVNAWTDLKILRQPHHSLKRGRLWLATQPLVHGGFLQTWLSDGLNTRVVERVRSIVADSTVDRDEFRLFVTGHSLGGALATLAAVDIALQEDLPSVRCVTFGAPRTGNHAFARAYNELVPDTWHVINDRDAVPRIGKFFFLFKRPGQRVLVNRQGDCRVRPDPVQVSLHKEGFSVKAHFLNAYRKALGAILRCQMIPLQRRSGGLEAFEAFAADKDMCLLGHYLGLDLKKLLLTEPSEIKLQKRQKSSILTPVRHVQLIGGLLSMFKFMLGAEIAEALKNALFRVLPCWQQDDSEEDSLASSGSRDLSEKGLQDSILLHVQHSQTEEV